MICATARVIRGSMPPLMDPAPIGRDKDNLIYSKATRPSSFFETPLVGHLASHSLHLDLPHALELSKSLLHYRASREKSTENIFSKIDFAMQNLP